MMDLCLSAWQASDLSNCKPLGLGLEAWFSMIGISIAGLVLLLWREFWQILFGLVLLLRSGVAQIWCLIFSPSAFQTLCATLRPLVRDNARIFESFGPKSASNVDEVRHDLSLWSESRQMIVDNNASIKRIIKDGYGSIPKSHLLIFDRWLSHIDAFEAHSKNNLVDYRNHQFPKEVLKVIGADA